MPVAEAYASRPEFAEYDGARLFPSRLAAARSQHGARRNRSDEELQALLHDRQICPRPALSYWGEPQWEGSAAQALLIHDVVELEKHKIMEPKQLWLSRDEYSLFDRDRFCDKIYQVERTHKFKKHMRNNAQAKSDRKK